jgi:hypothetical protein
LVSSERKPLVRKVVAAFPGTCLQSRVIGNSDLPDTGFVLPKDLFPLVFEFGTRIVREFLADSRVSMRNWAAPEECGRECDVYGTQSAAVLSAARAGKAGTGRCEKIDFLLMRDLQSTKLRARIPSKRLLRFRYTFRIKN